jgi:hypothetical protein
MCDLAALVLRLLATVARLAGPEVKLLEFQRYYDLHRAHAGLDGSSPEAIPAEVAARASLRSYRWQPHCRGLHHTPIAA